MTFQEWTDQLRATGHLLSPASSAVPVELWGLRPDGTGFHFRCRGVRVRLAVYRPGRARWQVPLWDDRWSPEEALSLWEHHPVEPTGHVAAAGRQDLSSSPTVAPPAPQTAADGAAAVAVPHMGLDGVRRPSTARLVFDDVSNPDDVAVVDGAHEWGWTSYEAGLLAPAEAAALFARLVAEVPGASAGPGHGAGDDVTFADAGAETAPPARAVAVPTARTGSRALAGARSR